MKYPVFESSGPKLTRGQLRAAENEFQGQFPEEYRKFMLARNGGDPVNSWFVVRPKKGKAWVTSVTLCAITKSQIDSLNFRGINAVLWCHHVLGVAIPAGAVAIGDTLGGAEILLFVAGRRKGQVWLKDFDRVNSRVGHDTHPEEGMTKVATSFSAFLAMLTTEEDADAQLNPRPKKKQKRS